MLRTPGEITAMKRRQLAALHASELNTAIYPSPDQADDDLTAEDKIAIQEGVQALLLRHRQELSIWLAGNS